MRHVRWWMAAMVGLVWLLAPLRSADARGKRAVPDLRRDAQRWVAAPSTHVIQLPITLHVATDEGLPVMPRAYIQRWVRRANAELRSFGIVVTVASVRYLPRGWQRVTRWQQRRDLARYAVTDGAIHVFVTGQLDKRSRRNRRRIRGLHWRYRGLRPALKNREYVVVARDAPTTTLAHELGHLFGLRHSTRLNNIMCSCRRGQNLEFTAEQGQLMRRGARAYVHRHRRSSVSRADRRRRR